MESNPLVVERTYNAPIIKVWKAITDKDQMKEWYFDIAEFRPEKGFKFHFTGGDENVKYLHECEVLHVDPPHKLSYSWRYPDREGYSVVTFELFEEGVKQTRVKLTHEGLDSFPKDDPNFAVSSFTAGWNSILGESLKNFVESDVIRISVSISAPARTIWDVVMNPNNQWGKAFGGGAMAETDWKPGSEIKWTDTAGNLGARGVITEHREESYLQMDLYDDVYAAAGTPTGEYVEKIILEKEGESDCRLTIEAGQLARKYIPSHTEMWQKAVEMIRQISESKSQGV